ncbi:metallopeptidase TldD-related protein [Myxococcus sp. K38C18041901]|uniref:metallopeptidase TldD-related protein n=1 Tax=Myxococcus guangdongensis TaxID=2906760 RepID=UPI0020A75F13|nr:metallopeptidase TldD-related protein [Myxococcus guangdongensis]MCP3065161.1 metallopeptidase TldD-related protein [Myxococcus guangdongensis]
MSEHDEDVGLEEAWPGLARESMERLGRERGWRGVELYMLSHENLTLDYEVASGTFSSSAGGGFTVSARVWTDERVGTAIESVHSKQTLEKVLLAAEEKARTGTPGAFPTSSLASTPLPTNAWRAAADFSRAHLCAERIVKDVLPPGVVVQALVVKQECTGSLLLRSDGVEVFRRAEQEAAFLRCETSRGAVVDAVPLPPGAAKGRSDLEPIRARLADAVAALEGPAKKADRSLPLVLRPLVAAPLVAGLAWLLRGDIATATPALVRAVGRKLFPSILTVEDDPMNPRGIQRRQLDDEGRPTRVLRLVDEGRLVGFLHSEETAARLGVEPGGRGLRDLVHPATPTALNLCILPREDTLPADYTELVARVENFSTMPTPGTVSLIAGGWEVRDGRRVHRVEPLELELPVLETFRSLRGVGSDLAFFPSAEGCGTPTLMLPPPGG